MARQVQHVEFKHADQLLVHFFSVLFQNPIEDAADELGRRKKEKENE
jgi:hypothetical protein